MLNLNAATSTLSIPRPQHGIAAFQVDLGEAYAAEARLKEIAGANEATAPFLASTFSSAYAYLGRAYGALCHEAGSATIAARKRRAHIILDLAPQKAKDKGLASSRAPAGAEDVREAICYQDDEYTAIEEYRAAIDAAKELVFIKLQSMKMGYEAVRTLMRGTGGTSAGRGVQQPGWGQDDTASLMDRALAAASAAPNDDFEPLPSDSVPVNTPPPQPTPRRGGFGKPLYTR